MTTLTYKNHAAFLKASGMIPVIYWNRLKYFLSEKRKNKDWFTYCIGQELWSGTLSSNKNAQEKVESIFNKEYTLALDSIIEYTKNW